MLRSGVLLVGLLLLVLAVANGADAFKRHPRSNHRVASAVNLENPNFNGVVNSSLGHYFVYYGNQFGSGGADEATPAALQQYCTDFSGSDYLNLLTQYYGRSTSDLATNQIHFVGQSIVGAPFGLTTSDVPDRCVLKILERLVLDPSLNIPFDASTQYYMILGSDVTISSAEQTCGDTGACGLHNQQYYTVNGAKTKVLTAWVATQPGCIGEAVQQLTGPNANPNTQSVLDTLSHEVAETITDPNQLPSSDRAWQTPTDGSEIGDLCTAYYGTPMPSTKKAGAYYNVLANGNEYMVQGQWSNAISGCALGIPVTDVTPSPTSAAGVTPSSSGAAPDSASVLPSPTPSPSAFTSGVPATNCITCPGSTCKRDKKFEKICTTKLGGTFSNATAGTLCCDSPSQFETFSWSVNSAGCDYPIPAGKLALLCEAVGGRQSCGMGAAGGVRITCDK